MHDPHNVSAILRSADAVGVGEVYLIYNTNKFPKIGKFSSASAKKWVDLIRFKSVENCFEELKSKKYRIYTTYIENSDKSRTLFDLNLTGRTALVLGNEHTGVSKEAIELSDLSFNVPMYGMVQSLNVSVTAAVCLYEALRQRSGKGMYEKSQLTKKELREKLEDYSRR
ncbi:MAG: RNA methyltransferase [Ignavibacteria bacterium]|nr:RNA methyltransferase [Ignavibacteria bacterium]